MKLFSNSETPIEIVHWGDGLSFRMWRKHYRTKLKDYVETYLRTIRHRILWVPREDIDRIVFLVSRIKEPSEEQMAVLENFITNVHYLTEKRFSHYIDQMHKPIDVFSGMSSDTFVTMIEVKNRLDTILECLRMRLEEDVC